MQVSVLASGSKGNCTFVEIEGVKLLIDVGISTRRIKQELSAIGQSIDEIDAVFITHEHIDHIAAIPVLIKHHNLQFYSRPATFRAMKFFEEIPHENIHAINDFVRIGSITVKCFSTSHDAVDSVGYSIIGSEKITIATDLGVFTKEVKNFVDGSNILILEANHDVEMLKTGSYSYSLKRRVLSKHGHLSNLAAGNAIVSLKNYPHHIFLAHLSQENNTPELALSTVQEIIDKNNLSQSINLIMTAQNSSATICV